MKVTICLLLQLIRLSTIPEYSHLKLDQKARRIKFKLDAINGNHSEFISYIESNKLIKPGVKR